MAAAGMSRWTFEGAFENACGFDGHFDLPRSDERGYEDVVAAGVSRWTFEGAFGNA